MREPGIVIHTIYIHTQTNTQSDTTHTHSDTKYTYSDTMHILRHNIHMLTHHTHTQTHNTHIQIYNTQNNTHFRHNTHSDSFIPHTHALTLIHIYTLTHTYTHTCSHTLKFTDTPFILSCSAQVGKYKTEAPPCLPLEPSADRNC